MAKLKKPLQQNNDYGVAPRKWRNWPDICQRVFNETYGYMVVNQSLFLHPNTRPAPQSEWDTTAWNAAWTAADSCQKALKDIVDGKGYATKPTK